MCVYVIFFFFKQKTAYDMRISDWSSDVCSSDLQGSHDVSSARNNMPALPQSDRRANHLEPDEIRFTTLVIASEAKQSRAVYAHSGRSEEHTSELQSLMRISYAVFCLTKKKSNNTQQTQS